MKSNFFILRRQDIPPCYVIRNTIRDINRFGRGRYTCYGLRSDAIWCDHLEDPAKPSRKLLREQQYDADGKGLYRLITSGPWDGYYDGGPLNGTYAIAFDPDDDNSILRAQELVFSRYRDIGHHLSLLAGNSFEPGQLYGEILIHYAVSLF